MIQITNWSSYQSYKDRRPPWIRLHKSLLDNYDFHKMSANARALLPMLWLLASEDEDPVSGLIRLSNERIAFRLRISNKDVTAAIQELSVINEDGQAFVVIIPACSESVTTPLLNSNQTVTPEERREEAEERVFSPPDMSNTWNERVQGADLPRVLRLTTERRKKCLARIKSLSLTSEKWNSVLDGVYASDFLTGKNDRKWTANFDWLIRNDENIVKVVEGGYR